MKHLFAALSLAASTGFAKAQEITPMEQFLILAIPQGIALAPSVPSQPNRPFVCSSRKISTAELSEFVRQLCRSADATFEPQRPSWLQWFRGQTPAQAIC